MSDYERHKGKLSKVETELSPKGFVFKLIEDNKVKPYEYYDLDDEGDFKEFCYDQLNELGYYISKNNVYKIDNTECDAESDIFEYNVNPDNSIDYQFMFYNGGTCLNEQVNELIDIIENKGEK